jgi:hypothetical protein
MKTISIAQLRVVTRGAIYPHRFRELALWRRLSHYLWSLMGFEGVCPFSTPGPPRAPLPCRINAMRSSPGARPGAARDRARRPGAARSSRAYKPRLWSLTSWTDRRELLASAIIFFGQRSVLMAARATGVFNASTTRASTIRRIEPRQGKKPRARRSRRRVRRDGRCGARCVARRR